MLGALPEAADNERFQEPSTEVAIINVIASRIRDWLGRSQPSRRPALILCGCDPIYYGWLESIRWRYEIVAMITREPWQHGTHVGDVKLYYPGEVKSLCGRFGVRYLVYSHDEDRRAIELACGDDSCWQPIWCRGLEELESLSS